MSRLTAQTAIIGAGRLVNMVVAAGAMMVLARLLPDKESYGAILMLLMLYGVLAQVFAMGLPQAIYYFMPRYAEGERRGFLWQVVALLLLSGAGLGVALFLGADALGAALRSPVLPDLLRIFAVYPACMLPTMAVEAALLTAERPATATVFSAAMRLAAFGALVIPIWRQAPLTHAVAWWMGVSAVAGVAAVALILSTAPAGRVRWSPAMLRDVWGFSLPLVALTAISLCGTYLDRFLVSHFFGAATFGTYANATVEVPTVTTVTNATAVVLLAEFSRCAASGLHGRMLDTWRRATTKTAVVVMASFGFLVFHGHETMQLLFSQRFADSGTIFSIYVWGMPLYLFALRPLYVAMGATRILAALTAVDVLAGAACMVVLGRAYGAPGIALGVIAAGYLGAGVWLVVFTRRILPVGLRAFMPWRDMAATLAIALVAGGIARLAHGLMAPSWPPLAGYLAALALYLPLYALGLRLAGLWSAVTPPWRARTATETVDAQAVTPP